MFIFLKVLFLWRQWHNKTATAVNLLVRDHPIGQWSPEEQVTIQKGQSSKKPQNTQSLKTNRHLRANWLERVEMLMSSQIDSIARTWLSRQTSMQKRKRLYTDVYACLQLVLQNTNR